MEREKNPQRLSTKHCVRKIVLRGLCKMKLLINIKCKKIRYSPFMPLGGTQGEVGCLDAEAKIGSRGRAAREAICSALRSPVQKRTIDWVMEELTSDMADSGR